MYMFLLEANVRFCNYIYLNYLSIFINTRVLVEETSFIKGTLMLCCVSVLAARQDHTSSCVRVRT